MEGSKRAKNTHPKIYDTGKGSLLDSLKIVCWNMNGHKSETFGNKVEEAETFKFLSTFDIVMLVETHSIADQIFIPGFAYLLKSPERKGTINLLGFSCQG